jgi:glycine oxidase
VVIGAGVAGLTTALACAGRGLRVHLLGPRIAGAASAASAGVLAPSVRRRPQGAVHRFLVAARDRYPAFLEELHARTGMRPATISGVLEVARSDAELSALRATPRDASSRPLDTADIAALEPTLRCTAGGWLHERDGAVDTVALMTALDEAVAATARIRRDDRAAVELRLLGAQGATVRLGDGSLVDASLVILAAGAWSSRLAGEALAVPIEPLAGEVAFAPRSALRCVVFGAGGYLVPRADELLVGATSDERGFDATPTTEALGELRAIRDRLLEPGAPGLAPFHRRSVGLRPMTPDGLPVIGASASAPCLLHACGYGRNGVLMAPIAADCVAALATGDRAPIEVGLFAPDRELSRRAS